MSLETSPGALGCPTLPMWHSRHYTVDVRHSYINVAILFMRGTVGRGRWCVRHGGVQVHKPKETTATEGLFIAR